MITLNSIVLRLIELIHIDIILTLLLSYFLDGIQNGNIIVLVTSFIIGTLICTFIERYRVIGDYLEKIFYK